MHRIFEYKPALAGCSLFLFLLIFCCGTVFAQAARLDSLLQLLPSAKADTNAVLLYLDLGEHYRKTGDLKSSATYHLKAQALSRELNYLHGLFYSSDYYSFVLNRQSLYDSAIAVNREMLVLALKHSDAYQAAIEKWNIGAGYANKGFNETALAYYIESLAYFEQANCRDEAGSLYNQIQTVYGRMYRYEEAIPYGEKALVFISDTLGAAYGHILLNLSVCYYKLRPPQDEKAFACLQKVLHIAASTGDAYMEAIAYNYIANIHFRNNRVNESEVCYRKALAFFREDTYPKDFCIANIGLAKVAMFRNDFAKAEAMAQKNLELSRCHGIRLEEKNTLSFLWELSAAQHNWANRLRYKAALDSVHNLVVNETMLRAAEELGVKYETEKKEMQITVLQEEKRLILWLGIVGSAVLLLALSALFFLWRWTVQKKRLAEKQKELAEQQIKQLEQEKQLIATQAVLDGEVQERTRLARDLHDGLGSILAAAKYNLIDIRKALVMESAEAERFDNSVSLLDDSMREMRRVAHHLMPESLGNTGLKQSIADFCNSVPIVKFSYYGNDTRLDSQLEVMIYRIMHELVSNALKHSGASHILVEIAQDANRIFLTVQDNGCGFDASTQSQGMGLANIRNRVAAYNGNVDIHSIAGEGTEINVEFQLFG
ncbi:MAG: sensor histidine kinase [Tannerellaceae bacterium]|jgi:signal transduction histidine kinase|nr:sensor histidine kinase [Tannerellaceae bacterium]